MGTTFSTAASAAGAGSGTPTNTGACKLLLLGVAQDAGLPQAGCSCTNCAAAWAGDSPRQYAVSAALIDESSGDIFLIDASPDFREQYNLLQQHLAAAGLNGCQLRGVLLTHLHMGHYTGLLQFGREAMDWKGLQVYGTKSVCDFFAANQPWATYTSNGNFQFSVLDPGTPLQLSPGLTVTAASVPHRAEFSDAVGFFIQGPSKKMFYLPDIDSWDAWLQAGVDIREVVSAVDVAFLDACFYSGDELPGRDLKTIPHPLIVDTAQRLRDVQPKRVVLVHMNHSNPVYREGPERQAVSEAGLDLGQQGTAYEL